MLLPWVGEAPILTIQPIDDQVDEDIDDLDDEPDANSGISSISGKNSASYLLCYNTGRTGHSKIMVIFT